MQKLDGALYSKQRFPSPNPEINMYLITYWSNGLRVKGLLAEPKGEGTYDGFLYLRGGIKNVGKVRPARIAQFAAEGFVVFAPFYRGNQGGEGDEDFAGEDRQDAVNAYKVLEEWPNTASSKIHIFGFSRGGVMALLAAIECPGTASVTVWGGVTDMALTYVERTDLRRMMKRVIGGTPTKYPERYKRRTPLYQVENIRCPILIIHGVEDHNVSIDHAYRLEKRLREVGREAETWYFSGFTHYFPPAMNRKIVSDLTAWMKRMGEK
ncbi:dipeptidyl aminopeptidase/acylaminoacyl peptidase [Peribacillus deserti]|uniref:Dipeptidyl aminopeptidase/acylaminoacyl peptidase n=1 Tax=Peribacillus deserti TaxID=673318 RepID=A0ABS2QII8_9BACI|nr:prolyl oligopeptidase family serine peptidase [Peribacillus deserti]MBM7692972.1 dipeptidyl aminopeptidase/acylaminoacyl peptidase [Peribacillus deserti]